MITRTATDVYNAITKQMKQREAITNSAATVTARAANSDELESLATMIEQSTLTIMQVAKRARIEVEQLKQFLEGDGDALSDDEQRRVADVVAIVKSIARKAHNVRRAHTAARAARKGTAVR